MFMIPTIVSLIEVVLVLVPALLAVAYVTVAERKTMASMQRRLGPNVVGQLNFSFKRLYHSSNYDDYGKALDALYINRKAPVKPFKENVVCVCKDLLSPTALNTFFKSLKSKSGIYMFALKSNPNIYYIGRAKDFQKRLKSHLKIKLNDRFHTFSNIIG